MLANASLAADLLPIVRVPTADYHFIAHALDVGAGGIVIPLVKDADQVRFAVECAMYPPRGRRGCAFAIAHDEYQGGNLPEKMQHTNDNLLMIAQIESVAGLENVEAIAAVPGIDALWIGQFDLTTSMGIPGQMDHPRFRDATRRIVDACHANGKVATLAVMDEEQLAAGPAHGFRLLVYAADLWIYQQALRRCFRHISERNAK
jgi:2-dehydro-3-deoxyglucarate aldolase/4-hydroxy-2-oxoheptanedioate aldolase